MDALSTAEAALRRIREHVDKFLAERKELETDGKYDVGWMRARVAELQAEAKAAIDKERIDNMPALAELQRLVAANHGKAQLRDARFVARRVPEFGTQAELQLIQELQAQRELLTELVTMQRLARMPLDTVATTFDHAIETGALALAQVAHGELQSRAASDPEAKGQAMRTERIVNELAPRPEVAVRVRRSARMSELIDDASHALTTGRDMGRVEEAAEKVRWDTEAIRASGRQVRIESRNGLPVAVAVE